MPPEADSNIVHAMRTGVSQGLTPRFEALPQFGKSPKSPCGVSAKALTPHPLHDYITVGLRLGSWIAAFSLINLV